MGIKYKWFFFIFNLLVLNFSFGLSNLIIFDTFWVDGWAYPSLFIVVNLACMLSFILSNQMDISPDYNNVQFIISFFEFVFYVFIFVLIYWFFVDSTKYYRVGLVLFFIFFFFFKLGLNYIFIRRLRSNEPFNVYKTLVIGSDRFLAQLQNEYSSNKFLGLDLVKSQFSIETMKASLTKDNIKKIILEFDNFLMTDKVESTLRNISETLLINVYAYSEIFSPKIQKNTTYFIGRLAMIKLFDYPLDKYSSKVVKRLFDVFFSLIVVLLVFSWLFPIIAILIFLDDPGPIWFVHDRLGIGNKKFKCFKFRSMYKRPQKEVATQTVKNDPRVTRIGKFIRKTSIDELPQFFNVLIGDLSVVGPRPMPIAHIKEYENEIEEMYSRHLVKPGITGLAQVTGYRGEIESIQMMKGRIRMDRYYLNNWSFLFDLKIILWTLGNAIRGDKAAI